MVADDRFKLLSLHRQPVRRLADEGARGQEEGRARARRQRRRDRRQDRRPRLGRARGRSSAPSRTPARSASASSGCSSTRTIWDAFMERFVEGARGLKVGDPLDAVTDVGPMVDANAGRADPEAGWTRRSRSAARSSLGGQGRRHLLRADRPEDVPVDGAGLLERGVRAARRRVPVPRLRRRDPPGQRQLLRAPDRRLHERPRAAPGRRSTSSRSAA